MSNYWVKRKVLGVLLVSLIMIAGMVFISQRAYADIVYDKWVEWGDVEDTVPTEHIYAGNPIAVSVSPEGEMWSYLFTPETTGPYLFYSDDGREDLEYMTPMGRVRAVDPATGDIEYIYEPEWSTGTSKNHFMIRFNAVKGRTYYIDTILKHPQPENETYVIKLEPDEYASVSYKPARRIEYLYNDDGTIDFGDGYFNFSTFWITQGEFVYTKNDGTKKIYKYHYDWDAGRIGEFLCGDEDLDIGSDWRWHDDNSSDHPWGPGQHDVTVYVSGKPMVVPVWIVKEYSYERSYDPCEEEADYTDDTSSDGSTSDGPSSTDNATTGETSAGGAAANLIVVGKVVKLPQGSVKVTSTKNKTVAFTKAKNKKSVVVPSTVSINKKTYKVTQVDADAFKGSKIRTVTIGKNVKSIRKNAFAKSKATKLIVKSKLLKKSKVKGCLKGSKIKTVQVKVSNKKSENKKYVKIYKKYFTKKNAGRKVTVK